MTTQNELKKILSQVDWYKETDLNKVFCDLSDNGILVPKCKVGDRLYVPCDGLWVEIVHIEQSSYIQYNCVVLGGVRRRVVDIPDDEIGVNVFLSKTEFLSVMKKRKSSYEYKSLRKMSQECIDRNTAAIMREIEKSKQNFSIAKEEPVIKQSNKSVKYSSYHPEEDLLKMIFKKE